jgi:hypothetical protein
MVGQDEPAAPTMVLSYLHVFELGPLSGRIKPKNLLDLNSGSNLV